MNVRDRCRVTPGKSFKLANCDPDDGAERSKKGNAADELARDYVLILRLLTAQLRALDLQHPEPAPGLDKIKVL
ncbi:MAG: hypothetical protein EXR39_14920 [Betaproteobacteria bacterium]|nr:hypothetical protein [Betaproteobacteria bacterium]